MIRSPFGLLKPYEDLLEISLITREDAVYDDKGIASVLEAEHLASLKQVHGNRTTFVEEETIGTEEADGMITDTLNLTLAIRSADCQTFAVYAPSTHVTGVLHVGWKGLLHDAIPAWIALFCRTFRVTPSEVLIVAGPSLCKRCAEFTDPLQELKGIDPKFFEGRNVDLQGIAEDQFFALGIKPEHFERYPGCTKCEPETYWSYRADKEKVGEGYRNVLAVKLVMSEISE